jgi:hypothetical protein
MVATTQLPTGAELNALERRLAEVDNDPLADVFYSFCRRINAEGGEVVTYDLIGWLAIFVKDLRRHAGDSRRPPRSSIGSWTTSTAWPGEAGKSGAVGAAVRRARTGQLRRCWTLAPPRRAGRSPAEGRRVLMAAETEISRAHKLQMFVELDALATVINNTGGVLEPTMPNIEIDDIGPFGGNIASELWLDAEWPRRGVPRPGPFSPEGAADPLRARRQRGASPRRRDAARGERGEAPRRGER